METVNTVEEHRIAPRHRVLKSAKIVLDDWRAIDCAVRDVSDTGAKLRIDGTIALPHKFQLLFITENTIRPVQIAWKHQDMIGVAFTGEAKPAPLRKLSNGI
jgi:ABC-type uncharacterized transport system ATPase subunit